MNMSTKYFVIYSEDEKGYHYCDLRKDITPSEYIEVRGVKSKVINFECFEKHSSAVNCYLRGTTECSRWNNLIGNYVPRSKRIKSNKTKRSSTC
jgi:hypothetical protein